MSFQDVRHPRNHQGFDRHQSAFGRNADHTQSYRDLNVRFPLRDDFDSIAAEPPRLKHPLTKRHKCNQLDTEFLEFSSDSEIEDNRGFQHPSFERPRKDFLSSEEDDIQRKVSRKRRALSPSSSESEINQSKRNKSSNDPHAESEIPFQEIVQGVADTLGITLTSISKKPSKTPLACMGSDQDLNQEENKLPLSSWLSLLWKDLDADIKGNNNNTGSLPKGKMLQRKVKLEKIAFSDVNFPLLPQKVQVSAEDLLISRAKPQPIIDFKSMSDMSQDARWAIALLNNALLMSATREKLLDEMFGMLDALKPPEDFSNLFETSRVLLRESKRDFGKALTIQTKSLANIELFRSDSVLAKVNKKVTSSGVSLLRSSTLLSGKMFEDSLVKEVQESTDRTLRMGPSSFGNKSRFTRPSSSFRSSFSTPSSTSHSFRGFARGKSSRGRGSNFRGRSGFRGKRFTVPSKKWLPSFTREPPTCTRPSTFARSAPGGVASRCLPSGLAEDSGGHLDVRPHHQGSLPFVSHAPSTIQCSSDLLPIWRSREARDIGGFGVGDDRKEGCRTSVANKFTGVLQPAFPGTEEGRLLETRHRPVRSQQSPHNPLLSYGDVRADHECRPSGRVADLVGPDRCVLSHTHLPDTQEVSSLCGEGSGLSVHRSPVRTVDGSICLLETGQVCGGICSYSQSFSPPIPRRLAPQSTHPFYVKGDNSVAPVVADCSGFQSQFQKIRHESRATEDISRNSVRSCQIPGSSLPGPHPALPRGVANVFNETSAAGIVLAEIDRPPSISHEDCSFRSHDAQADSKKPEFPMEPGVYDSISQGSGLRRGLISSAVVVGGTEPPTGDVPPPISTPSADVYRCFNSGVGCLSELTIRSGHLGCERIEAHQYSGNDCGAAGLPVLHRSHPGPRPPGIVRQHHCGGVHQPPGRYSV